MANLSRLATRGILRSFSRDTHAVIPVKQDLWPSEELVDLLERQEPGLGVEEVDERDEEGVEDAEVHEGEDPVGGCGEGGSTRSDGKGGVLGGHWFTVSFEVVRSYMCANIISLRRPRRSMIQMGIKEEKNLTLLVDSVLNLCNGTTNRLIVLGDGLCVFPHRPKNLSGLVVMVVVDEPTGRLGKEENPDEGQDGEEDLEGEREAELGVVADEGHAVVNPPSYDTANDHLRDSKRRGLKSSSNAENNTAHHDTLATTKVLSKDKAEDGTKETSDLINCDHSALE
ncbi:hypothetical protein HG530_001093 [Fusarium avenaceum]|nr:hypothetical protein HG530_001093 [Fusarium avenaceum]